MPLAPSLTLRKSIGLPHAVAMVVGTIIGASIFVQPSEITGRLPSFWGATSVWVTAGFLTFLGAIVTARLARVFPETGGVYVYLRETISPVFGFLWGWAMFWVMHTGIIAAIATVFARYAAFFFQTNSAQTKAIAILVIGILTAVNYVGVAYGSKLQTMFTAGKVLAVFAMIAVGFTLGGPAHSIAVEAAPVMPQSDWNVSNFLLAIVAGLFAFGGWHMVTYAAEETLDADSTIPKALIAGVLIVTLLYVALNAVYFYVLPVETVRTSVRVAADAADAVLGTGGAALMSGLVMFSTFGAIAGIVLAGPRVYYAMARDGLVFSWMGAIHPTFRTPHRAILLQGLWSAILTATGTYRVLFTRVIYTEWIFFGLMAIGLVLLERDRNATERKARPRVFVPIAFALSAFAVVINQVIADPTESLVGLSIVGSGIPVYFIWRRMSRTGENVS